MANLVRMLLRVSSLPVDETLKTVAIMAGTGLLCSLTALLLGWNFRFL